MKYKAKYMRLKRELIGGGIQMVDCNKIQPLYPNPNSSDTTTDQTSIHYQRHENSSLYNSTWEQILKKYASLVSALKIVELQYRSQGYL